MKHEWLRDGPPVWSEKIEDGPFGRWERCVRCGLWRQRDGRDRLAEHRYYFGGEPASGEAECKKRHRDRLDTVRCYMCGEKTDRWRCQCGCGPGEIPYKTVRELLDPNCDILDDISGRWFRAVLRDLEKSGIIEIKQEIPQ